MSDILAKSAHYIDNGVYEGAGLVNRPTTELSEVGNGIALIEAFSHVVAIRSGDGLVLFDTSLEAFAGGVLASLRRWSEEPVTHVCYTHGHADHVGGTGTILCDACERGHTRPQVVAHENVSPRFRRYELTNGYNFTINARQFAPATELRMGAGADNRDGPPAPRRFGPDPWVDPDTTFREAMTLRAGDLTFQLNHAIGETDDHLWAWIPEHKAICSGDFVTWVFPNAGNPQKVQRYPLEWAKALRDMAAKEPELLLPAHGLPIEGRDRIAGVLDTIATALETLVSQTLEMMNAGRALRRDPAQREAAAALHGQALPQACLRRAGVHPAQPVAALRRLVRRQPVAPEACARCAPRRRDRRARGRHRQCHRPARRRLPKRAWKKTCGSPATWWRRRRSPNRTTARPMRPAPAIYGARRSAELSLMSKGIFGWAERESKLKAGQNDA